MSKYSINITNTAKHELREIVDYYFSNLENPLLAVKVLRKINETFVALATFPEGYQIYEGKTTEKLRSTRVMHYRIFYKIDNIEHLVSIIHIIYAKRNLDELL